jgi:hypothetical protein
VKAPKPLSWTAVRNGATYCAPACGGGCTWSAFMKASHAARKLAKRLGRGWKPRVWENLGWHFEVVRGPLRIHQYQHGTGPRYYRSAFCPDGGPGTPSEVYVNETFSTPQAAIRAQVAAVHREYGRWQKACQALAGVLAALLLAVVPAGAADVSLLAGPLSSDGLGEQRFSGAVAVEVSHGPFDVALRYDSARKIESGAGWIGSVHGAVEVGALRLGGAFVHRDGGVWAKDTFWLEPGAQAGPVTVTLRAAVAGQTEREYGARVRLDADRRLGAEVQVLRHHDGQFGKTAFLFFRVGR